MTKSKILIFNKISLMTLALITLAVFLILSATVLAAGPTADAGPARTITEGELTRLRGSGTGEEISYFWSCNGGSLSNPYIAQPNFIAPFVKQDTNLICNLVVSDENGSAATDSTTVLVKNSPAIASFQVSKKVRNLSKGQTAWYKGVSALPGDKILFQIIITASGNQASQDIKVKDTLPSNLRYQGELKIDTVSQAGNITREGIEIESIRPDQSKRITFAAQVAVAEKFTRKKTDLVNTAIAYNLENSETSTCRVTVTKETGGTLAAAEDEEGPGGVRTGVGPTLLTSILFPLGLAGLLVWLFKSQIIGLDMIFARRKKQVNDFRTRKKLKKLISHNAHQ